MANHVNYPVDYDIGYYLAQRKLIDYLEQQANEMKSRGLRVSEEGLFDGAICALKVKRASL
jgi:hypothetical protein